MSHASKVARTICRAVNVVSSGEFIEDFKTVNDQKNCKDHETKNTSKAGIDCDTIHQAALV
jgi:ABC-type methionine transport system ATPase subunit